MPILYLYLSWKILIAHSHCVIFKESFHDISIQFSDFSLGNKISSSIKNSILGYKDSWMHIYLSLSKFNKGKGEKGSTDFVDIIRIVQWYDWKFFILLGIKMDFIPRTWLVQQSMFGFPLSLGVAFCCALVRLSRHLQMDISHSPVWTPWVKLRKHLNFWGTSVNMFQSFIMEVYEKKNIEFLGFQVTSKN